MPSASALLALVVVLNSATTSTTTAPAPMPADACLQAMRAIWHLPAETVAIDRDGKPVPAVDAYCEPLAR